MGKDVTLAHRLTINAYIGGTSMDQQSLTLECMHCHRIKPDDDFNKDATRPDRRGRNAWCRECTLSKDASWRYGQRKGRYEERKRVVAILENALSEIDI